MRQLRLKARSLTLLLPRGSLADDRILYGRKPVLELLRHRPESLGKILYAKSLKTDSNFTALFERLLGQNQAGQRAIVATEVTTQELDRLSNGGNHQGVLAFLTQTKQWTLEELIAFSRERQGVLLALDELNDPQNVGSLLRVAEATGVDGVIITEKRSAPLGPTVRKVSAGASELVPCCAVTNLHHAIREMKDAGIWIVGTFLGESAQDIYTATIPHPLCVVLGSEGKGLRALTVRECDVLVKIPMLGALESINVSQAGAVVLFELVRRGLLKDKRAEQ